jgi:hypothetical protein
MVCLNLGCSSNVNSSEDSVNSEQVWVLKKVRYDHMVKRQEGLDSLEANISNMDSLAKAIVNYRYPKPKNEDFYDQQWNLYLLQLNFNNVLLKPAGKSPIPLDFKIENGRYRCFNDSISLIEVEKTDTSMIFVSSNDQDNMKWMYFEPVETRSNCHRMEVQALLETFSWHSNFFKDEGVGGSKISDFDAEILEYEEKSYTHIGLDSGVIVEEFTDIYRVDCFKGLTMILHGRAGKVNSFILIPEYIADDQIDGTFIGGFDLLEVPGQPGEKFTFIMQPIKDG